MHDDTPVCNVRRRHCEAATVTRVLNLYHFGTRSGGGIKSVVLHASSVGLGFGGPRARSGDMLRSPRFSETPETPLYPPLETPLETSLETSPRRPLWRPERGEGSKRVDKGG